MVSLKAIHLVGAKGAFVFAEVTIFRAIISGEVIATGARIGVNIRIIGVGFGRIINRASKKGNSEILLGDKYIIINRDILLVFTGICYNKDFT